MADRPPSREATNNVPSTSYSSANQSTPGQFIPSTSSHWPVDSAQPIDGLTPPCVPNIGLDEPDSSQLQTYALLGAAVAERAHTLLPNNMSDASRPDNTTNNNNPNFYPYEQAAPQAAPPPIPVEENSANPGFFPNQLSPFQPVQPTTPQMPLSESPSTPSTSGGVNLPGFTSPESAFYQYQNRMEGQLCQICGELAAGFHHGAYVCEACKVSVMRVCVCVLFTRLVSRWVEMRSLL